MGPLYRFFQLFPKICLQCNPMMYMLFASDQGLNVGGFLVM